VGIYPFDFYQNLTACQLRGTPAQFPQVSIHFLGDRVMLSHSEPSRAVRDVPNPVVAAGLPFPAGISEQSKEWPRWRLAREITAHPLADDSVEELSRTADAFNGEWLRQARLAKLVWGKLTLDELVNAEGQPDLLAELLERRYSVCRETAIRLVKSFFLQY